RLQREPLDFTGLTRRPVMIEEHEPFAPRAVPTDGMAPPRREVLSVAAVGLLEDVPHAGGGQRAGACGGMSAIGTCLDRPGDGDRAVGHRGVVRGLVDDRIPLGTIEPRPAEEPIDASLVVARTQRQVCTERYVAGRRRGIF